MESNKTNNDNPNEKRKIGLPAAFAILTVALLVFGATATIQLQSAAAQDGFAQYTGSGEFVQVPNKQLQKNADGTITILSKAQAGAAQPGKAEATANAGATTGAQQGTEAECDPAYPDMCLPSPLPDLNCGADVGHARNIAVLPPDPHKLDRDLDGLGCDLPSQQVIETVESNLGNEEAVVVEEQVTTEETTTTTTTEAATEEIVTEEIVVVQEEATWNNVIVHILLAKAAIEADNKDAAKAEVEIAISLVDQIAATEGQTATTGGAVAEGEAASSTAATPGKEDPVTTETAATPEQPAAEQPAVAEEAPAAATPATTSPAQQEAVQGGCGCPIILGNAFTDPAQFAPFSSAFVQEMTQYGLVLVSNALIESNSQAGQALQQQATETATTTITPELPTETVQEVQQTTNVTVEEITQVEATENLVETTEQGEQLNQTITQVAEEVQAGEITVEQAAQEIETVANETAATIVAEVSVEEVTQAVEEVKSIDILAELREIQKRVNLVTEAVAQERAAAGQ